MNDISAMAGDLEKAMEAFRRKVITDVQAAADRMAAAARSVDSPFYGVVADATTAPTLTGAQVRVRVEASGGPGKVPGGVPGAVRASQAALDTSAREAGLDRRG